MVQLPSFFGACDSRVMDRNGDQCLCRARSATESQAGEGLVPARTHANVYQRTGGALLTVFTLEGPEVGTVRAYV